MKTALVTGVSKGIGKAICIKLLNEGYFVYGTYNTGKKEAQELKNQNKNLEIFRVDFSKRDQTLDFIKKLKDIKFDAIVNNAGFYLEDTFENTNTNNWDKMLETMLTTPNILIRGLAKSMNNNSSIVNICSIYGTRIYPNESLGYTAAKAGLAAITKALSVGFAGKGVRVNGIAPGIVDTQIAGGLSELSKKETIQETPVRDLCKPTDIANVTSFLLSENSKFINGQVIVVDGGHTNYSSFFSV